MKHLLLAAAAACPSPPPGQAGDVVVTADRDARRADRPLCRQAGDPHRRRRAHQLDRQRRARCSVPAGTPRIDLPGMTLLPGLIDMHVHLDSPADIGGYSGLQFTDRFWAMTAVGNAKAMLDAGFTTVRNVGSAQPQRRRPAQAIDDGYAVGPRIVPAGYALGATGGHCDSTFFPPLEKDEKRKASATAPRSCATRSARQRKYGAEVIKICATGGVFSRNTEPGQQQLTRGRDAGDRRRGAPVGPEGRRPRPWRRRHQGRDPRRHRHHRARQPDRRRGHPPRRRSASSRCGSSMDIYNTEYTQAEGKKNGVLEDNLRKDREIAEIQRENFRKAHRGGREDGVRHRRRRHPARPQRPAVRGHGPLRHDAAARRSSRRPSTPPRRSAATDVGVIEAGRYGDLVAVDRRPARDVTVLERPDAVIKGGRLIPPS